nr:hypothetical protein [Tanacetum cinerariifolium]
AAAQLQLRNGGEVLDKRLLPRPPGQRHRRERSVAIIGPEARRAIRPQRRREDVAVFKGVIDAAKERGQRIGGVVGLPKKLPGGRGVLDAGVGVGAGLAQHGAAFVLVV